jgi:ATP-binding cassette subfamily B protein
MPVLAAVMNICYAVIAVVGGIWVIRSSSFTIGSLGVYLNYTKNISIPINMMSNQLVNVLSALAGAERIFAVMDTPPEVDEGRVSLVTVERTTEGGLIEAPDGRRTGIWAWKIPKEDGGCEYRELKGDVRFKDVHFSYVPGKPVLKGISVYAKPGQKIAFVGSTGAGKTTITNLINRFYEIDSGQITFDGIDIRDIEKKSLRRSLGMVLQDTNLFTGTVMDNIRYGKLDATDEECIEAAKSANAHGFISRLPDGYQTMITGNGQNLSQGQRQLLAIARTAVAKHPVMIMDEATSSIDTRTEKLIERGMDALMEGKTVFVIAHRLSTVRNSKVIAVVENGEIIEKGSHEELLANKGRYYMLYTGQHQLD